MDGSFRCSPFHVRFGKLSCAAREKVVSVGQGEGDPRGGGGFWELEQDPDFPGVGSVSSGQASLLLYFLGVDRGFNQEGPCFPLQAIRN